MSNVVELGTQSVRSSVLGADKPMRGSGGGRGRDRSPPPSAPPDGDADCPVVALGHLGGVFHFLDCRGQKTQLSARALGGRSDLLSLFLGDDTWLRARFPKRTVVKRKASDGSDSSEEVTVDFQINKAAAFLMAECGRAGLFGDHVVLRRPGVWPGADGAPIVHCGDVVIDAQSVRTAGTRSGDQVWSAAPPTPRPALACDASIGKELQLALQRLWRFRLTGGVIAAIGLLGTAYLGAAARWRPAGFLFGGAGSGKSSLLAVLRACCPMHQYSNDTTKSGLETALDSRAMPSFIDETSDQDDQRGARRLLDLVLTASGGEGTKGLRGGGNDSLGRRFEVAGTIVMASINPPEMKPQHLGRFTLIELMRGEAGVNFRAEHDQLVRDMRAAGPGLWGRALAGWDRYQFGLRAFGDALGRYGCNAREMDQIGALLAGWWVLTEEGNPTDKQADGGVLALTEFIRGAADVERDDAPRRMVAHLFSTTVQLDRSTARAPIGELIDHVLTADRHPIGEDVMRVHGAVGALKSHGIRVVRADDDAKKGRGSVPRPAEGAGVWFAPKAAELRKLFDGTDFGGDRWLCELKRFETAREPKWNVRIGGLNGRCVWVSAIELGLLDEEGPIPEPIPL